MLREGDVYKEKRTSKNLTLYFLPAFLPFAELVKKGVMFIGES